MFLTNLGHSLPDLIQPKYFSSQLFTSTCLPGKAELQPQPILDALTNGFQVSRRQVATADDFITRNFVRINRIPWSQLGQFLVFVIDHVLYSLGQPSVWTIGVSCHV